MKTLSLFSGIGGMDLGLERAGFKIVMQVEWSAFCRAVLAKHWPDVPCLKDVRELVALLRPLRRLPTYLHERAAEVRRILSDLFAVVGGFPCQDISVAGKGAGVDEGWRSGLWKEMRRVIAVIRPHRVIAENVPALRTRGADRVLGDLERIGYTATPCVVGAEHVGAPHKRHRVFILGCLADSKSGRCGAERGPSGSGGNTHQRGTDGLADAERQRRREGSKQGGNGRAHGGAESERGGQLADPASSRKWQLPARSRREGKGTRNADGAGQGVGDTLRSGRQKQHAAPVAATEEHSGGQPTRWPAGPGQPQFGWEQPRLAQFPLGSAVDGVPVRLVRFANRHALHAYGNAVVPQVAEVIGVAVRHHWENSHE